MYVKTYQNASTNWIVSGEMEILKITQRQHNTHTKTVLRDKFVKSNWVGCADFAGEIGGWCDNLAIDFRMGNDTAIGHQTQNSENRASSPELSQVCLSRVLIGKLTSNSKSRLASGGHIRRRASAS